MPPASAPSHSGARRTPCWARRWGKNVQWGMKAWSGNRRRGDLPMCVNHTPVWVCVNQRSSVITYPSTEHYSFAMQNLDLLFISLLYWHWDKNMNEWVVRVECRSKISPCLWGLEGILLLNLRACWDVFRDCRHVGLHVAVFREFPKHQIYFPWRMQHENIPNTHGSAYCC